MTSQKQRKQRKQILEFLKEKYDVVDVIFQYDGAVACRFSSGWRVLDWEEKLIKQAEACKTEKDKT